MVSPQRSLLWWLVGMLFLSQMETISEPRWLTYNSAMDSLKGECGQHNPENVLTKG